MSRGHGHPHFFSIPNEPLKRGERKMNEEKVVDIKEVEKKLEEMHIKDIEVSPGRELKGPLNIAVFIIGLAMSLFHIYVLTIRAIDPWYFRTMHVVFAGVLVFALIPGWKGASKDKIHFIDYLFILLVIAPAAYIFIEFDEWIYRVGVVPNQWDFFFSTLFVFVLFGAFVEASGAGKFFVDFARCAAGRLRGGPAKVSIISSAIIGTASGSSVANVVVDGVFNIPLMKASGFRATAAGAIEAMNSTGGQITPQVLGARAC